MAIEFCFGEIPIKLDFLVMVVGYVDGFGSGSVSEEGESRREEGNGERKRIGGVDGEGM